MSRDPLGKWVRSGKTKEQETAEALAHRRAAFKAHVAIGEAKEADQWNAGSDEEMVRVLVKIGVLPKELLK